MAHFVYMLRCADGTLYTGYTTDIEHRLRQHNGEIGGGARYTRGRGPVTMVHQEAFATMSEALRREAEIKRQSREQKERLALGGDDRTAGGRAVAVDDGAAGRETPDGGLLQVCATPIGNLGDITLRVLEALKEADLVAAEDTRQTRKLLTHFEIHADLTSYHEHNKAAKGPEIVAELQRGKRVALVSDAGLPGVSDPGEDLIRAALAAGIRVEVLPGASAALTALVGSGLPTSRFAFEGFLPRAGKERRSRLASLASEPRTLIFYEAPHRLRETLADLLQALGDRPVAAARELTKRFEEFQRGRLSELVQHYQAEEPRGEYTLVVAGWDGAGAAVPAGTTPGTAAAADGKPAAPATPAELAARVQRLVAQGIASKEAMRQVAQAAGLSRREVYRACLDQG